MSRTENNLLIQYLIDQGALKMPAIIRAFRAIDRVDFVPDNLRPDAYFNMPISIGHNVTTSQPSTIALMLETLKVERGQTVLEIGTGSGYVTALLARLVGARGMVYSIECVTELKAFAEANLTKYHLSNIELFVGDGKEGLIEHAPFDRIIASAEAQVIPESWKNQLAIGGILLTPINGHITMITKQSKTQFSEQRFPFFSFVKLT